MKSPSMPAPPTPGYHYGVVTKYRRIANKAELETGGGEGSSVGIMYEYSDTKPEDMTDWEEYQEKQLIADEPNIATEEARNAAADEKAKAEAELLRKRRGRKSTILTGGQGVTGEANTQMPTLLGGNPQRLG